MTGAVRTGAARTATAERAICAGANASTEEHKASISIPSDEAIAKVPRQQRRSRGHAQRTTRDEPSQFSRAARATVPAGSRPCSRPPRAARSAGAGTFSGRDPRILNLSSAARLKLAAEIYAHRQERCRSAAFRPFHALSPFARQSIVACATSARTAGTSASCFAAKGAGSPCMPRSVCAQWTRRRLTPPRCRSRASWRHSTSRT